jgi:predicted ATPase/class 3 adenylate cyclase
MGAVREVQLPTGLVTLLFSDIEGSTRMLTELGDAWGDVLAEHHRVLREAWMAHGGIEVGTEGDAFFVAFTDPAAAIAAAALAQRALAGSDWPYEGQRVRVRIGVHTGHPKVRDGNYWGLDVHYAARLASAASGGQVLVSESTAGVVEGVELEDLGEHALKDFPSPRRLFHLVLDGRGSDRFPAPRTVSTGRTNLPAVLSSFIGRDRELEQICALVEATQLVTLVGPGGVGKTRLSLTAAARLLDGTGDGVWLVELAALSDPRLVARETARVLGIGEVAGKPVLDTLVEAVRGRRLLLVLDNCEHVIGAVAELVAALVTRCPGVFVLATSREPLGVVGERVFRVPSLSVAQDEEEGESEAMRLFVERAREHRPDFTVHDGNAQTVGAVVRRLDGIPLALELAAARLRSLSIGDLSARLDRSLAVLSGGPRTASARQQTVQGLMDWSYELLSQREQSVFAALAVFAGGFELDAAEQVCAAEGIDSLDVVDLLGSLVDKSLVQVDDIGERLRYRMLEIVREYAAAKLAGSGEERRARLLAAHRDHYLAQASVRPDRHGSPEERSWADRFELENDNIRAALDYCLHDPQPEPGLLLAASVAVIRFESGRGTEAAEALLAQLNRPEAATPTRARARALLDAVHSVAMALGNLQLADQLASEGLAIARSLNDDELAARALDLLSPLRHRMGRSDEAVAMAEEAVALVRRSGNERRLAHVLATLGTTQRNARRDPRAALTESAGIARRTGRPKTLAWCLEQLGLVALAEGNTGAAREYLDEVARLAHENGWFPLIVGGSLNLGLAAYLDGDLEGARAAFIDTLRRVRENLRAAVPYALHGLALTTEQTDPVRAARLHGVVDRMLEPGEQMEEPERRLRQESRERLRARLGDIAFEAHLKEGAAQDIEALIESELHDQVSRSSVSRTRR